MIENTSISLHGRIYYPIGFQSGEKYPAILLFHGVNRDLNDNDHIARLLVSEGYLCFSITFHGHGQSNGTFPKTDGNRYNESFADALGAYRYLSEFQFIDQERIYAIGTSLGGAVSIFLAVCGLVQEFVGWYPAIGITWGSQPLYNYTLPNPSITGLLLVGTADECGVCVPEYNSIFLSLNEQVQIHWLDGAMHTDGRFYSECVKMTQEWFKK
jgi:dienelactone hydrolase